jgi:type I restriction enzyme, R subunit
MNYERTRVEQPAIDLLVGLGWTFVAPADLKRSSIRNAVLQDRLERKLLEFNPWLSVENLARVIRKITTPEAIGLMEANEEIHTLLTLGTSVQQDVGLGMPSSAVRYVDWERFDRNDFVVTQQFRVKRSSVEHDEDTKKVVFDLALFVNGLLWAVIECKDFVQGVAQALEAGKTQLERYQELTEGFRGMGAPRVFQTVQLVAVVCREAALYASVGAVNRFFAPFPEAYPNDLEWLGQVLGLPLGSQPTNQDVLLYSVFSPSNLLELTKHFSVFEISERRKIRKVARHQQRIAVDRTIRRVLGLDDLFNDTRDPNPWKLEPAERGGVIWHTQGSGKSLTMVWLAQALKAAPLGNPSVLVVTDRVDLDKQVDGVFRGAGLATPERAKSVSALRRLLSHAVGATIMTTVQKFQDATERGILNASEKIFVLVDEAHRTQYGLLAARMRGALPNATFIAFTGTPIDKKDRSTLSTFGSYIHRYTMIESVRDGATVPIFYEGRDLEKFFVAGRSIDEVFDHWFADYNPEDREKIKNKFATLEAVAGAPARVKAIAWDMVKHYQDFIADNGFKAQVVVASREIAVRYKEAFDALEAPPSEVIFTVSSGEDQRFAQFDRSPSELDNLLTRFAKEKNDPVKFLIVVDMLLTGFDAPLEQVMYLDKPLREHTLLQAIARVNRPAELKDRGFIVDYWGVTDNLREALSIFDAQDIRGVMRPLSQILDELASSHQNVMKMLGSVGGERIDITLATQKLEDVILREEFKQAFKFFSRSFNALLPDPRIEPFELDFKWASRVWLEMQRTIERKTQTDWSGIAPKVRKLIDESIQADGITQVIAPIDILSDDFDTRLKKIPSEEAQALEMTHALLLEIEEKFLENPMLYSSLRERLEKIIASRREKRSSASEQVSELLDLVAKIRNTPQSRATQLGLSANSEALYGVLEQKDFASVELARTLEQTLQNLIVIEWQDKEDVQREMRRQIGRNLRAAGVAAEQMKALTDQIIDVARARMNQ